MENLSYETIKDQLVRYLQDKFDIKKELNDQSDVLGLGLDSLDVMDYIFYLEETFSVMIEDEQIQPDGLLIIGETAKYVIAQTST